MGWWTSKLTRQSTRWRWLWMGWWTSRLRMKSTRWMRRKSISLSDKLYFWRKILTFQPQPQPGRRLGDHRRPWRVHGGGQQHGHWGGVGGLGSWRTVHIFGAETVRAHCVTDRDAFALGTFAPPYFGIASPPILGHLLSLILDICSRTVVLPLLGHLLSFTKLEQYHGRLWLRLNRRPEEDLPTVLWHVVQPRGQYFLFAAWGHPCDLQILRAHHLYTMVTTKHSEAGDPIKAIRESVIQKCTLALPARLQKFKSKLAKRMQEDLDLRWTKIWNKEREKFIFTFKCLRRWL